MTRAASALNISQSALSRQIQGLERRLGVQLFTRDGKKITITPEGQDLLPRIHEALDAVRKVSDRAGALRSGDVGVLRIGATPQTIGTLLPNVLLDVRIAHPEVEIVFAEGPNDFLLRELTDGHVDAIVADLPAGYPFPSAALFMSQLYVVISSSHELAGKDSVDIRDLAKYPVLTLKKGFMTRSMVDSAVASSGTRLNVVLESDNTRTVCALAEAGHGVALISSTGLLHIQPSVAVPVRKANEAIRKQVSAAWDQERWHSSALRSFIEILPNYSSQVKT